jgi:hypothetical protein
MENFNPDFEAIFADADSAKSFLTQVAYFFEAVIHYVQQLLGLISVDPAYVRGFDALKSEIDD